MSVEIYLMEQLRAANFSDRPKSSNPFTVFIFRMLQVREDELMQSVLNLVPEQPNKKKCCK